MYMKLNSFHKNDNTVDINTTTFYRDMINEIPGFFLPKVFWGFGPFGESNFFSLFLPIFVKLWDFL